MKTFKTHEHSFRRQDKGRLYPVICEEVNLNSHESKHLVMKLYDMELYMT